MLSIVVLSIAFGSFGMDVSHSVTVREQMQAATDAGALAGVRDFVKPNPPFIPSSFDQDLARRDAIAVTGANNADGKFVKDSSDFSVTVDTNITKSPYTVTVTATRQVSNIFARVFGKESQAITTTSTAAAWQNIKTLHPNQALNLAVSLDHAPERGPQAGRSLQSLSQSPIGQKFTIDLNSQQEKNAAWIKDWSNENSPSLNLGDSESQLDNGVRASTIMGRGNNCGDDEGGGDGISEGQTIMLPVIKGAPPYNYKTKVVGVLGFKVTKIDFPRKIEGTIVTPIIFGVPGKPSSGPSDSQGIEFMSNTQPWQVMLIN
jgi:hypothetical protein